MRQSTKNNPIDPITVIVCALKACKCAADYHRIASTNTTPDLDRAWQSLSQEEQQRITRLVSNDTPTDPQILADELIACGTALELKRIKAEHGEDAIKAAWKLLPQYERDRIKAICDNGATESKLQQPSAMSLDKQPKDISQMTLAQLSTEALTLWEKLEATEDESALLEVLQGIEKKVDAIAWVDEQYSLNIEASQVRLERLNQLHTAAIERMISKQQALRNYLLQLYHRGLIQDKLVGSERTIAIRQNPPKCELKVEPESLPDRFVEVETKTIIKPQKKAIVDAWKQGEDVNNYADISIEYRVQFSYQTKPHRNSK